MNTTETLKNAKLIPFSLLLHGLKNCTTKFLLITSSLENGIYWFFEQKLQNLHCYGDNIKIINIFGKP